MIDQSKKTIRVRDVMKKEFDMIDGKKTVMDALRTMKHVETKSLIIDKRSNNDEYGMLLISDIAKNVLAKDRSPHRMNVYEIIVDRSGNGHSILCSFFRSFWSFACAGC